MKKKKKIKGDIQTASCQQRRIPLVVIRHNQQNQHLLLFPLNFLVSILQPLEPFLELHPSNETLSEKVKLYTSIC